MFYKYGSWLDSDENERAEPQQQWWGASERVCAEGWAVAADIICTPSWDNAQEVLSCFNYVDYAYFLYLCD